MSQSQSTPDSTTDPFLALRSLTPFKLFSSEELREIVPLSTIESFPADTIILGEGEPSNNLAYFMISGGVTVTIAGKFILALRREGDIFGEMSLINDEARSATVKTTEPSQILIINSALTFTTGEESYYKFRYLFSRMFNAILTHKLRMTSERARLYEDAMEQTEQAKAQSSTLQEQIRDNMLQIRIYSHLVDSAKEVILIVATDGTVLEANRALRTEFGVDPGQMEGQPFSTLLTLPDGQAWPSERVFQTTSDEGWSGEIVVLGGKDGPIPADCTVSLVKESDDTPLAFAAILRNTQVQKTYEARILQQSDELKQANEELVELDHMKDNFIGLISHELRTPLTSIISYSEMLGMEGMVDEDDRPEFVDTIHREALVLNELVNKVITISKIESGQAVMDIVPGRLGRLVDEQVAMLRDRAVAKNLTLTYEPPEVERDTKFDGERIREVLRQLIGNAVQFTEEGGVKVRLTQNENESLIEVRDTGKGMEKEEIDNAFNRFAQIKTMEYHQSGIGLGLPLAFLICRAHGGGLLLDGEPGKGTKATVRLPFEPAPAHP